MKSLHKDTCIHHTGSVSVTGATYGPGTGPIYLTNMGCIGTEPGLAECSSALGRVCSHNEDAGVRCLESTGMITSPYNNMLEHGTVTN